MKRSGTPQRPEWWSDSDSEVDLDFGLSLSEAEEVDEDENWDDWDDQLPQETKSLFSDRLLPNAAAALQHDKETHGFDFELLKKVWELDFFQSMRLFNYVRSQVGTWAFPECRCSFEPPYQALSMQLDEQRRVELRRDDDAVWKDPKYLQPVIEGDPLLTGFDEWSDDEADEEGLIREKQRQDLLAEQEEEAPPEEEQEQEECS